MRSNLKLLKTKRLFLWLIIVVNCFALLLLLTALINRFKKSAFLDHNSLRFMGFVMVVCLVIVLIFGITYRTLCVIWQFRSNRNIAAVQADKKSHAFWLWSSIFVPFLHILFPFIFIRRYFHIMRFKVNFDLKRALTITNLYFVFGMICFLSIIMFGLIMNSLQHMYFYLLTIAMVAGAISNIIENLLYLQLINLLKKIDLAVIHQQVQFNENEVIDY